MEQQQPAFMVKTTVLWPDGQSSQRIVDWNNRQQAANFSRIARAALDKGAEVRTKRVSNPA